MIDPRLLGENEATSSSAAAAEGSSAGATTAGAQAGSQAATAAESVATGSASTSAQQQAAAAASSLEALSAAAASAAPVPAPGSLQFSLYVAPDTPLPLAGPSNAVTPSDVTMDAADASTASTPGEALTAGKGPRGRPKSRSTKASRAAAAEAEKLRKQELAASKAATQEAMQADLQRRKEEAEKEMLERVGEKVEKLPNEVLLLVWLQVECPMRFQLVCRRWNGECRAIGWMYAWRELPELTQNARLPSQS